MHIFTVETVEPVLLNALLSVLSGWETGAHFSLSFSLSPLFHYMFIPILSADVGAYCYLETEQASERARERERERKRVVCASCVCKLACTWAQAWGHWRTLGGVGVCVRRVVAVKCKYVMT